MNSDLERQIKYPIRKVYYVGTYGVLTLDLTHVKRLSMDKMTFFIQKPVGNGIIIEKRRLDTEQENLDWQYHDRSLRKGSTSRK